jgi:hypothetical protein|tara:strand:+ start:37812 stop:37985 length:174 start_codon:yes stop_codon:yes gene_type:complete
MKIDYIVTPDMSRAMVTVEKLVSEKNRNRVKKVSGVHYTPLITRDQKQIDRLINLYG